MRAGSQQLMALSPPERRCPAPDDAGEGAARRLERAPVFLSAAMLAAARCQLQCADGSGLAGGGTFKVVERTLPCSARHDEGRARRGSASRSAAAAFKPASDSAPAHA